MGVGGMALHQWVLGTKTFQKIAGDFAESLIGEEVGREGVDDDSIGQASAFKRHSETETGASLSRVMQCQGKIIWASRSVSHAGVA
jgi:hypothetical protein